MTPAIRLLLLAVALGAASAMASPAQADHVVVVLDRGAGAKDRAADDTRTALTLVELCRTRGDTLRVMAVGARANGKPRVLDLKLPLEASALAELDTREGLAFEGPSDARAALAAALRGSTPRAAVTLVLVGPFGRVEPTPEGTSFALDTWNRTAPAGSRILPLALAPEGATLLSTAEGYQASGHVLLTLGPVEVAAEPWSAFHESPLLRAVVRVPLHALAWGTGPSAAPQVRVAAGPDDVLTPLASDARERRVQLEHPLQQGLSTQVRVDVEDEAAPSPGSWLLATAPPPVTVAWSEVLPEVRWQNPAGHAPRFSALDLERGVPREARYRYRRTAPTSGTDWLTVVERSTPQEAPPSELTVTLEAERRLSPVLVEGDLLVVARPGDPRGERRSGRVVLQPTSGNAEGPLSVEYELAYVPGRVRVVLSGPEQPLRLPSVASDKPVPLQLEAGNANAPAEVDLHWSGGPPDLTLRLRRGSHEEQVWRRQENLRLSVGVAYLVRPLVPDRPGAAWPSAYEGTLTVTAAPTPATEVECVGEIALAARRPRWKVDAGEALYRVGAAGRGDERPLRLSLHADGAEGGFLAWVLEQEPRLEQGDSVPQAFALERLAPGRYEVRRQGDWKGSRPDVFSDRNERVPLSIVGLSEPVFVGEVAVLLPARWGRLGYALVGLAALAALLGIVALRAHRVEPVGGTLLYTLEGRTAAVGKLPLTPVGRRRTPVTLDGSGRLSLSGKGPVLLHVVPTRVGGMLEVSGANGQRERRLLVDGLSLTVGRHALRYVQAGDAGAQRPAATPAVPDLLGPEYDLPHGPAGDGVQPPPPP